MVQSEQSNSSAKGLTQKGNTNKWVPGSQLTFHWPSMRYRQLVKTLGMEGETVTGKQEAQAQHFSWPQHYFPDITNEKPGLRSSE